MTKMKYEKAATWSAEQALAMEEWSRHAGGGSVMQITSEDRRGLHAEFAEAMEMVGRPASEAGRPVISAYILDCFDYDVAENTQPHKDGGRGGCVDVGIEFFCAVDD